MVIEARDRRIDDLTNDATPEASDHQRIRARHRIPFLSLSLSVRLAAVTPLPGPQSFVMYVTRS